MNQLNPVPESVLTEPGAIALSVRNLHVDFLKGGKWNPIVQDISFDIAQGNTLAVVGESGSGKSVTALSIMRLLPIGISRTSGSIQLGQSNLQTLHDKAMRRIRGKNIAMIFQENGLDPVFTIGYQMYETLHCHYGMTKAQARAESIRLLDRVHIPAAAQRLNHYPHEFSGGMRQRVMIALALASRPQLLIADEPTTALDVTVQAQILNLMKTIQQEERLSMLFITHDMGVVAEMADHTLVMHAGRAIEHAPTHRVLLLPAQPYTRQLIDASTIETRTQLHPVTGRSSQSSNIQNTDTDTALQLPLLQIKDLSVRFNIRTGPWRRITGNIRAARSVSLNIFRGETLGLVGESGSGKSTVGRCILRMQAPTSGTILLEGKSLTALSAKQASRRIQMIFQDPAASLNPRMTIGQAIAEPLVTHGLADHGQAMEQAIELLTQVGLTADMATRYPHQFSGGQRQRICIARALALRPELIVADEAVSALDATLKAQVISLLHELQQRLGLAYLFISHDMAAVRRISHRVAVMQQGRIVETGPCEAVFDNAQHPYTRQLLSAVPVPDPAHRQRLFPEGFLSPPGNPIVPVTNHDPSPVYREVNEGHWVLENETA